MLKPTAMPREYTEVEKGKKYENVLKTTLVGIDELQSLVIPPHTTIKMHGHDRQWEVWICLKSNLAFVCPLGDEHELRNKSDEELRVMAIKGSSEYSFEELRTIFKVLGFAIVRGSMTYEGKK